MTDLSRIFEKNEIPFGYRIGYLFNFFAGPIYRSLEVEEGLVRPDFATLFCAAHLQRITASDVTDLTGIPKNSISRAVAKLARRRYLKREADGEDSRRVVLTLTPAGKKVYANILERFQRRETQMMAPLSAVERAQLDRLLAKLVLRGDDWAKGESL